MSPDEDFMISDAITFLFHRLLSLIVFTVHSDSPDFVSLQQNRVV